MNPGIIGQTEDKGGCPLGCVANRENIDKCLSLKIGRNPRVESHRKMSHASEEREKILEHNFMLQVKSIVH